MAFQLLTPCCAAPIDPDTEWGGHTVGEIVVGYSCSECLNLWDRAGNPLGGGFDSESQQADILADA